MQYPFCNPIGVLLLVTVGVFAPAARAQHDDCALATPISGEGTFPFTTVGTTFSGITASCNSGSSPDGWFRWTPVLSGSYLFTACNNADYSLIFAVRNGGCGGFELACEWQGCQGPSGLYDNEALLGPVVAGTEYWVQVTGWQGSTGSGVLDISRLSPDALGADHCTDAVPISGFGTWIWNAWSASSSVGIIDPYCGNLGADVWFAWTAPFTGFFQLDGCTPSTQHPSIAVYRGHACPPPPSLGCTSRFCTGGIVRTQALAGEPFLIRVGGADRGQVNIAEVVPLPNDECVNAQLIAGVGTFPYVTAGASDSQERPTCATTGILDVWFEWTSAGAASYRFNRGGAARGLAIYDACGGAEVFCTESWPFDIDLPASTRYWIQLYATQSEGTGNLIIEAFNSPPNDDCADAITIAGPLPQPFDTTGATTDGPSNQGCGSIFRDIWFEWTAPTSDFYRLSAGAAAFTVRMELFEGASCPPGSPTACAINTGSDIRLFTTAGQSYLLRVGGAGGLSEGSGSIGVSTFVPPANDELAGAIELPHEEGSFAYSTSNATLSPDPLQQSCVGPTNVDVWLNWTPPENFAFWRFQAGSGSRIAIYNASTLVQLECGVTIVNGGMNFFTEYLVRIAKSTSGGGSLLIERYHPAGGFDNDECDEAHSLFGLGTFEFNNLLGTTEAQPPDPTCGGVSSNPFQALWFDWTAPASSTFRAETCGLSGINTILAVFDGNSCPALTSIACSNNACGLQSRVEWSATEGQHYLLRIGNQFATPQGYGLIRISDTAATGLGTIYCTAVPTSSGEAAQITAAGSTSMTADDLSLTATGLPSTVFGLFFFGANQLTVPLGDGTVCVGGQVFRLPIQQADAGGVLHQPNFWDLSNSSFVMPGSTWNFQSWFRDAPAGMSGFNLSNALSLFFTL